MDTPAHIMGRLMMRIQQTGRRTEIRRDITWLHPGIILRVEDREVARAPTLNELLTEVERWLEEDCRMAP